MALRFSYSRSDGGVSICGAAPKKDLERVLGPLTDEQYRAHVIERSIPKDAINLTELPDDWRDPEDRTFRDAWEQHRSGVSVNMPKARDIHMDRIRKVRNAKLDALDKDHARAAGRKIAKEADAIEAEREALRNIPQTFDLSVAKTPEQLAATWPETLTTGEKENVTPLRK